MYSLKKIFRQIFSYKKEWIKGNVIAVVATSLSIPIPLLIPTLIDEIILKKQGWLLPAIDHYLGKGSINYYVVVILCAVLFLRSTLFVLSMWQNKIFKTIAGKITFKIRQELLLHLQHISMSAYESVGSGVVASYLVTDVKTIDEFIGMGVSKLIISVLTVIGVAIVLIWIHPLLAFFILVLNPLVSWISSRMGKRIARFKEKENSAFERFQEKLLQTLELFPQIRAANKEKYYIEQNIHETENIRDTSINFSYLSEAANRLSFLIFIAGYEIFRILSIFLVLYSSLSLGMMLAVFGYVWFIMPSFQELLNIQYALHNAKMALVRINKIFAMQQEPQYPHVTNPFAKNKKNSITLKNISFAYTENTSDSKEIEKDQQKQKIDSPKNDTTAKHFDEKETLQNINMQIEGGSRVAIVGSSGSGKTTLAHIMVGFYSVSKGEIFYNDVEVKSIGLDVIRSHVSLILQNPALFQDTLKQNLTLGENISEDKIMRALEIAQIKNFVLQLPQQLETDVGKNGIRLSGGQKQRIAIARMILSNPSIVILDESTSALDVETEINLFHSLLEYLKDKTVIIIAHRLSTIRKADTVFVLENGKIVEHGKPEELSQNEGHYSDFINRQT